MITFLLTGCLITAFLYHLGLFVLNRRRAPTLVFAICCLLLACMVGNLFAVLLPGVSWYTAFRLEYIVGYLTFAGLCLFLQLLFPALLHHYATRAYYALAGLYILSTFVLPTRTYSTLRIGFDVASAGMILYVLVRLAMQLCQRKPQNTLAFAGMLLVCLFGLNDILYTNSIPVLGSIAGQYFTTPIAMSFFVFCYALVVALEYADTQHRMEAAQRQVAEAEARYLALLDEAEAAPVHKTPAEYGLSGRETDVLWLLLDGKTRPEIAGMLGISLGTVNTYCSRIYRKTGTNGLPELYHLFGVRQA